MGGNEVGESQGGDGSSFCISLLIASKSCVAREADKAKVSYVFMKLGNGKEISPRSKYSSSTRSRKTKVPVCVIVACRHHHSHRQLKTSLAPQDDIRLIT